MPLFILLLVFSGALAASISSPKVAGNLSKQNHSTSRSNSTKTWKVISAIVNSTHRPEEPIAQAVVGGHADINDVEHAKIEEAAKKLKLEHQLMNKLLKRIHNASTSEASETKSKSSTASSLNTSASLVTEKTQKIQAKKALNSKVEQILAQLHDASKEALIARLEVIKPKSVNMNVNLPKASHALSNTINITTKKVSAHPTGDRNEESDMTDRSGGTKEALSNIINITMKKVSAHPTGDRNEGSGMTDGSGGTEEDIKTQNRQESGDVDSSGNASSESSGSGSSAPSNSTELDLETDSTELNPETNDTSGSNPDASGAAFDDASGSNESDLGFSNSDGSGTSNPEDDKGGTEDKGLMALLNQHRQRHDISGTNITNNDINEDLREIFEEMKKRNMTVPAKLQESTRTTTENKNEEEEEEEEEHEKREHKNEEEEENQGGRRNDKGPLGPVTGSEDVSEKPNDVDAVEDAVSEKINDVKSKASKVEDDARSKVSSIKEEAEDKINEAKEKAKDALGGKGHGLRAMTGMVEGMAIMVLVVVRLKG